MDTIMELWNSQKGLKITKVNWGFFTIVSKEGGVMVGRKFIADGSVWEIEEKESELNKIEKVMNKNTTYSEKMTGEIEERKSGLFSRYSRVERKNAHLPVKIEEKQVDEYTYTYNVKAVFEKDIEIDEILDCYNIGFKKEKDMYVYEVDMDDIAKKGPGEIEKHIRSMEEMWKNVGAILGKAFEVEKVGNIIRHTYIFKEKKDE